MDLEEAGLLQPVRRTLVPRMPIKAYFPDFLTPYQAHAGPRNGIDALAATSSSRVRHEVDRLRRHAVLPAGLDDPELPPVLIFPAPRRAPDRVTGGALPDLLGSTRARVLYCIAAVSGCTTSELARRTGTSLSTAGAHAQVLHRAGLITSTRNGNMVIHQITRLGRELTRH